MTNTKTSHIFSGVGLRTDDYNNEIPITSETVRFSIERMLADKLMAILSRKRFRRTKDLYDLWIITNNFNFSYKELQECIANRGLPEWDNIPFNETTITEYKKAWDKLSITSAINSRQLEKPAFEEAIQRFYAIAIPLKTGQRFSYWNHKELQLC